MSHLYLRGSPDELRHAGSVDRKTMTTVRELIALKFNMDVFHLLVSAILDSCSPTCLEHLVVGIDIGGPLFTLTKEADGFHVVAPEELLVKREVCDSLRDYALAWIKLTNQSSDTILSFYPDVGVDISQLSYPNLPKAHKLVIQAHHLQRRGDDSPCTALHILGVPDVARLAMRFPRLTQLTVSLGPVFELLYELEQLYPTLQVLGLPKDTPAPDSRETPVPDTRLG